MAEETIVEQTPPQDVPYVDRVYSALKDNLSGFDKTPEQFKTAMKDSGYAAKAYTALKDNLSGFGKSEDDFYKEVGIPKKASPSGGPNTLPQSKNGFDISHPFQAPTDLIPVLPEQRAAVRERQVNDAHSKAISVAQQQRQTVQPTTAPQQERGVMDKISQALYVPAIKQGFNDLIVSPMAGATDLIDRTMDKAYRGITGEETPEWLRKKGFFHDVNKQIQEEYDTRDKPKNMASDITEGVVGTLPLMASMFTGEGEVSIATKAPQLFGRLAKTLATTKGLTAYKDATDNHYGYLQSLEKGVEGAAKGGLEGQFMEAQMLVGGALGKKTANILAKRGLLVGGKAGQAILHALSVGTVFGGTSAGEDLLQGKEINTDEALKQFGTGLAFELIPTAKGIHDELKDRGDGKKINEQAAQLAAVANSASNLNGESAIRTLINTPIEQIAQVNTDITKGHEDLYADSIEKGAQAYDAKNPLEKKDLYTQQLALKAQGDIKMIADKVKQDPTEIINSINENDEISPEDKVALIDKINALKPTIDEQTAPNKEIPVEQPADEAVSVPKVADQNAETTKNSPIKPVENETSNEKSGSESSQEGSPESKSGSKESVSNEKEIVKSGEDKTKPDTIEPTRQKAIDAITHGIIGDGKRGAMDTSPRFDLDMKTKEQERAIRDITNGNYETAAAKKMIDKVAEFEQKGEYPVIEGQGGKSVRGKAATAEEIQANIDDAKQFKLAKEQDIEANNKGLKDLGITHEDIQNYENYRNAGEPGTIADNGRAVENIAEDVQRTENDQKASAPQGKGGETAQDSVSPDKVKAGDPLREFANKVREGKISKLSGFRASTGFDGVWDASLEVVAKSIEGGAKIADAIEAGLKHIRSTDWYKSLSDKKEFDEKYVEHMTGEYESKEVGDVKKTVLTKRAYEGGISEDVKTYLEDKGLTRKSFMQEERSKQAKDFINKFGEDAAFKAVEAGDIEGGMAASTLAQLQVRNSRAMDKLPEGSPERDALAKKQSDIIELMGDLAYTGGEFNGQLAHEYQDAELNYANVKKQVEKLTGRALTPGQDIKIKKLTSENEKLRNKLKEAEAKLIDETDKAFETEKPEPPVKPKTEYAKKALDAVVKVRAKIRANSYSDATGMVALVDSALATIEGGIRTGMTVSKAIEKGIEQIKTQLKKRGIDIWDNEDKFRKDVTDAFADEGVVDNAAEQDIIRKQQANIKRLEKELENAKQDRLKESPTKRESSPEEDDLKQQIKTEKLRISRENMQEAFLNKTDNKFTHDEAKDIWGYMKGEYLENGEPYKDALSKTAQDLGLSWRQVSEAITTPKNKRISDEMWERNAEYARNNNVVKNWVGEQNRSDFYKLLKKISGTVRGIQVFGHGHVFIGTHAGMTLFTPRTTATTIRAFFNGWKLAYGKEANYERAMEELKNSPNYVIAQRAGLKNNPDHINGEEYQKNQHYLGRLGSVGERGFNAIKVLRQNLFDHEWNKLTPAEQADPEVAKSIAEIMNLATGATTKKLPEAINEITFAGGMEMARWQKLLASPSKAANTAYNALVHPEKASVSDRVFAKLWARRVGQQLATYTTAMMVNGAIQSQLNPKNPSNFTDPDKPDFMKFKFGDLTLDPTSGMRSTAAFLYKLGKVGFEDEKNLRGDKRSTVLGKDIAKYSLGKLAPLYGTIADFYNRQDFNGNVMPFSHDKPASYAHKLTWGEYAWQKTMLPVAEAANVTYQSAFEHGANKVTLDNVMKGIMTGALSGATGFRVGEFDANSPANNDKIDKPVKHLTGPDGTGYVLTDEQATERQKLNEEYIAKHKVGLTTRFTREAKRSKELKEDIRKAKIGWDRNELSAKEQEAEKKKMVDDFIESNIKQVANARSKPIILNKYKKGGKYLLNKSE